MKFVRPITHEEMLDIANNRNDDPSGLPSVYILATDNNIPFGDGKIYRVYGKRITVSGIKVDPKTEEWFFELDEPVWPNVPFYPTLKEINEYVKSISKFWDVPNYDIVVGYNVDEATLNQTREEFEAVMRSKARTQAQKAGASEDLKKVVAEDMTRQLDTMESGPEKEWLQSELDEIINSLAKPDSEE